MKNDYSEVSSIITNVIRTRACHISRCWTKLRGVLFAFFRFFQHIWNMRENESNHPFPPIAVACVHARATLRS